MGWECHWVWRNVCFSYRHFTCPVTPCPPRARLIFGKAATRTGPLCGGFALGRCCPVLVAALPLWVSVVILTTEAQRPERESSVGRFRRGADFFSCISRGSRLHSQRSDIAGRRCACGEVGRRYFRG